MNAMRIEQARQLLGLGYKSSKIEVREAYLKLIRQIHPDVSMDEDATEKAVELNEAYELLLNVSISALKMLFGI